MDNQVILYASVMLILGSSLLAGILVAEYRTAAARAEAQKRRLPILPPGKTMPRQGR